MNPTKIIPTRTSSSSAWIEWHKTMKSRYGKKQANILFVKAWDKRGGAGTSASTNELREYMKNQGVTLDTTTMEGLTDTVSSGLDTIGDIFNVGKYFAIGTGVIVISGLAILVWNVVRNPIKSASTAANFMPAGRALKTLK